MNLRHLASAALAVAMVAAPAAGAFAHSAPHPKAAHAAKKGAGTSFIKSNAKKKTVTLTVKFGLNGADGGFNFDGYAKGAMVVTVPLGWTVDVVWSNVGELPHSIVFETWSESLFSISPTPAFKGAQSPDPVVGSPSGSHGAFHFKVTKAGKFRFVCAFPGHAALGMWDTLIVKKGIKAASVKA